MATKIPEGYVKLDKVGFGTYRAAEAFLEKYCDTCDSSKKCNDKSMLSLAIENNIFYWPNCAIWLSSQDPISHHRTRKVHCINFEKPTLEDFIKED